MNTSRVNKILCLPNCNKTKPPLPLLLHHRSAAMFVTKVKKLESNIFILHFLFDLVNSWQSVISLCICVSLTPLLVPTLLPLCSSQSLGLNPSDIIILHQLSLGSENPTHSQSCAVPEPFLLLNYSKKLSGRNVRFFIFHFLMLDNISVCVCKRPDSRIT